METLCEEEDTVVNTTLPSEMNLDAEDTTTSPIFCLNN